MTGFRRYSKDKTERIFRTFILSPSYIARPINKRNAPNESVNDTAWERVNTSGSRMTPMAATTRKNNPARINITDRISILGQSFLL
jgi:hypothetical protein